MNEIVNNFLLAEDKVMPQMYLRQCGFLYKSCGPFMKNKERIQKCKETGDSPCIYQNELDKAFFQLDRGYGSFKDLTIRTVFDKIMHDKALILLKIHNMMEIKEVLL